MTKVYVVLHKTWEEQHPDCSMGCQSDPSCYVFGVYLNKEVADKEAKKLATYNGTWGEVEEKDLVQ